MTLDDILDLRNVLEASSSMSSGQPEVDPDLVAFWSHRNSAGAGCILPYLGTDEAPSPLLLLPSSSLALLQWLPSRAVSKIEVENASGLYAELQCSPKHPNCTAVKHGVSPLIGRCIKPCALPDLLTQLRVKVWGCPDCCKLEFLNNSS